VTETVRGPGPSPRLTEDKAQTRPSDAVIDALPETTEEGWFISFRCHNTLVVDVA